MNILYVVVSDETDTYLEQTILSIESLRRTDKNAAVYVVTEQGTERTLVGKRHKLYDAADYVITVNVPEDMNKKNRSRFLKTTMYDYVNDDFLYIDGDTVICESLSDIAGDYDVAAVADLHMTISECPLRNRLEEYASRCGFRAGYNDIHFNSGLMWVRKCGKSKEMFEQWHKLWKEALTHGVTQDQTSLNEVNCRMNGIIHELDGIWNCQMQRYGSGLEFLSNAKMIHYFASNTAGSVPYDLSSNKLLRRALDDVYPYELQRILDAPKASFRGVRYIIADPVTAEIIESYIFILVRRLYDCAGPLYKAVNKSIGFIVRLERKIRKKQ